MGWKVGSFYRIKNKEEKNKISDWRDDIVNLVWDEKEQRNKCRAQSWLGFWGLADWTY